MRNQKGFSGVTGLLLVIIVVLIAVVGWLLFKQHAKNDTTGQKSGQSSSQAAAVDRPAQTDESTATYNGRRYSVAGKKFNFVVPNGMVVSVCRSGDKVISQKVIYKPTAQPDISNSDCTEKPNSLAFIAEFIKTGEAKTPPGTFTGFGVVDGINGSSAVFVYSANTASTDDNGSAFGASAPADTEFTYMFPTTGGAYYIRYYVHASQSGQGQLVQDIIRSFKFNLVTTP